MSEPNRLYRWFDAEDVLLYVGITVAPIRRTERHITKSLWARWATRMELGAAFATRAEAIEAERLAIASESPVFNVLGAEDHLDRLNQYLARKGEQPVQASPPRAPGRPARGVRWGASVSVVSDFDEEFAARLGLIGALRDELIEDIETTPDAWTAVDMAAHASKLVYETADLLCETRRRILRNLHEREGLSYLDLGKMLGVSRMRAHQIVTGSKRRREPAV